MSRRVPSVVRLHASSLRGQSRSWFEPRRLTQILIVRLALNFSVRWGGRRNFAAGWCLCLLCVSAAPPSDPLSLWERVGVRGLRGKRAGVNGNGWEWQGYAPPSDPLSLRERVGVRGLRGKQAGVNGKGWEREGYWSPSPGLRPPSPKGRGVEFGGEPGPPSPKGRGVEFGASRAGLRPPSPKGRGVEFGASRAGLRPPSPRGRGVEFGAGRAGLRPPSPRGRGAKIGVPMNGWGVRGVPA